MRNEWFDESFPILIMLVKGKERKTKNSLLYFALFLHSVLVGVHNKRVV